MKIGKPQLVWQLSFEGAWPTSVAFVGNRRVAAGNRDGQIYVWQLPERSESSPQDTPDSASQGTPETAEGKPPEPADLPPVRRLDGHTNGITQLRAAADDRLLISASLDRSVRLWDLDAAATGTAQVVLDATVRQQKARGKPAAERPLILDAPGATVETIAAVHEFEGHGDWIQALGLSGGGRRMISGDDACRTIVWDLATRTELTRWTGYDRVWVTAAALSPDGSRAFTAEYADGRGSFDRPAAQARIWDAENGKLELDLVRVWLPDIKDQDRGDTYAYAQAWGKLFGRGLVCAQFSPDGTLLAVGQGGETGTGQVHLIQVSDGAILRTVSGHQNGVCDVRFSADGKYVLSSGRDTMVRICQVEDGKEVATLGKSRGGQFKDWLHALTISPDQRWVAAADIAGMVQVWQLDA
jgi:WD40 repeat protein